MVSGTGVFKPLEPHASHGQQALSQYCTMNTKRPKLDTKWRQTLFPSLPHRALVAHNSLPEKAILSLDCASARQWEDKGEDETKKGQ